MFFIVIVQKEEFMKKEYIRIKLKLNLNLLIVKKNDRKLNLQHYFSYKYLHFYIISKQEKVNQNEADKLGMSR